MVKCIVIGAAGRMGMRIINAIHNTEGSNWQVPLNQRDTHEQGLMLENYQV